MISLHRLDANNIYANVDTPKIVTEQTSNYVAYQCKNDQFVTHI